ncbi:MAG TPA: c-type cytochrome [Terriglobales bacterium]|jgi:cbb3-type cytochrome c oxidase subunit III|nr:c-type cytochrome [Terriglobales bacterium]
MKDPSRIYRWLLLVASLVTVGYLVGAAVHENYLAQWKTVQRQYRDILRRKATDDRGRELLAKFHIEMKQVSIPALGAVDRCVTCHNGIDDPRMTDVEQPHRIHPGHILDKHPVDRFGCTICHHGQGAALTFREAKADDVYWDYPLLPPEMTEATCVTCHDAGKLPSAQIPLLTVGMKLYQEKSCGSCHKLGGRGGALGPALDNEGAKTKHQLIMSNLRPPHTTWNWQLAHFRDPGGVVADSQMRNPTVTQREALALTVYMLSQWKRDVPESYLAPDKIEQKYRALHPTPLTGEQVYQQYCTACHGNGTYSRWDKKFNRFVPAIRGVSLVSTASRDYLQAQIEQGRPGTQMPAWGPHAGSLLPEEIAAVIAYLQAGAKPMPAMPMLAVEGNENRGLSLFLRNCAGCHGMSGRGGFAPEIGNRVFQQAATDEFIVRTIRNGRVGTAMPAFQRPDAPALSDQDIADILAFLRTLGEGKGQEAMARAASADASSGGKR